jgi:cellulose synthase/poly-beta-1,6-N-acetylglucosamine synthase-like glycosyltransferase
MALKAKMRRWVGQKDEGGDVDIHEDQKISEFMEQVQLLRFLKKQFNHVLAHTSKGDTLKARFIRQDETMFPKISIVTPSYQQGEFIEDTIQSVLTQHYPNLEYILIDGGSKDQTLEKVRQYENLLTYWVSEKDSGQSEAINKGLRHATGNIVSWLCSDDILLPGALFRVAKAFAQSSRPARQWPVPSTRRGMQSEKSFRCTGSAWNVRDPSAPANAMLRANQSGAATGRRSNRLLLHRNGNTLFPANPRLRKRSLQRRKITRTDNS